MCVKNKVTVCVYGQQHLRWQCWGCDNSSWNKELRKNRVSIPLYSRSTTLTLLYEFMDSSFSSYVQFERDQVTVVVHVLTRFNIRLKLTLTPWPKINGLLLSSWLINVVKSNSELMDTGILATRHVFVKHGCPRRQQSQNMAKFLSPIFWPRQTPRGMGCQWSVRNPLMNLQSKFGNCMTTKTLDIALCKRDGITDKRTDRRTDGRSKH